MGGMELLRINFISNLFFSFYFNWTVNKHFNAQLAITCSNLTIETLEQGVK